MDRQRRETNNNIELINEAFRIDHLQTNAKPEMKKEKKKKKHAEMRKRKKKEKRGRKKDAEINVEHHAQGAAE